jgi:hypothetical protein
VRLSKTGAELLFELVSQRYERGSTLITSNLPFDEWTETFGSERLTGALLDRVTHHVNILEMNGESYRLAQSRAEEPAENPHDTRRRRKRETLVGLRPPDVLRLRRQVADFYAATWQVFAPPLTKPHFCDHLREILLQLLGQGHSALPCFRRPTASYARIPMAGRSKEFQKSKKPASRWRLTGRLGVGKA